MYATQSPRSAAQDSRTETESRHLLGPAAGRVGRRMALRMLASAAGAAMLNGGLTRRALSKDKIPAVDTRLIAINIPGASAIAQIGTFLANGRCAHPIEQFPLIRQTRRCVGSKAPACRQPLEFW